MSANFSQSNRQSTILPADAFERLIRHTNATLRSPYRNVLRGVKSEENSDHLIGGTVTSKAASQLPQKADVKPKAEWQCSLCESSVADSERWAHIWRNHAGANPDSHADFLTNKPLAERLHRVCFPNHTAGLLQPTQPDQSHESLSISSPADENISFDVSLQSPDNDVYTDGNGNASDVIASNRQGNKATETRRKKLKRKHEDSSAESEESAMSNIDDEPEKMEQKCSPLPEHWRWCQTGDNVGSVALVSSRSDESSVKKEEGSPLAHWRKMHVDRSNDGEKAEGEDSASNSHKLAAKVVKQKKKKPKLRHYYRTVARGTKPVMRQKEAYDSLAVGFRRPTAKENGRVYFSIKDASVKSGPKYAFLVRNGAHEMLKRFGSFINDNDDILAFRHMKPNRIATLCDSDLAGMHAVWCLFATDVDPIFIRKPSEEQMLKLKEDDKAVTSSRNFAKAMKRISLSNRFGCV